MKPIRTNLWVVHNGKAYIMEARMGAEVFPDMALEHIFHAIDQQCQHRFKLLIISPETKPNPKGFEFT